jgi:CHU_C Type IX secretion signal domain
MNHRLTSYWVAVFCAAITSASSAQFVLHSDAEGGVELATSSSTQIAITGNLINNSNKADFSQATLSLVGTSQNLTNAAAAPIVLGALVADGGGTKTFAGAWEVAGQLTFNSGVVSPGTTGKLVHSISVGSPADVVVNDPASYVNGIFYSRGTGARVFPIGNSAGYFPAQLSPVNQGDLEIGMRVVNGSAGLTHGSEILDIFTRQYWELIDPSNSLAGPIVALSSLGASGYIQPTVGTVVIAGSTANGAGASLGGGPNRDLIVGTKGIAAGDKIFTLAKVSSDKSDVIIHNIVTPLLDNANDYLYIFNIHIFPENNVTLLDRWGGKVREWSGYKNFDGIPDPTYDLSTLPTGNYICILEYRDGSNAKKLSQMITIINQ